MDDRVTRIGGAAALHVAQLVAARICHDLSSPLGGLGAALAEANEDASALPLAQDAGAVLRQRLLLFRAAWGGAPMPLPRAALRDLAGGLPNAPRLRLQLDDLADSRSFASATACVVVCALLVAAESLPRGGMLALAGDPAGVVLLTIAGTQAAWPQGLGAMLASAETAWAAAAALSGPAGLQALPGPMLALLAQAAGVRAGLLLARTAEPVPPLLLDFSANSAA